jgi:hypothetical protein
LLVFWNMRIAMAGSKRAMKSCADATSAPALPVNSSYSWLAGNLPADIMRVIDGPRETCCSESGFAFRHADDDQIGNYP